MCVCAAHGHLLVLKTTKPDVSWVWRIYKAFKKSADLMISIHLCFISSSYCLFIIYHLFRISLNHPLEAWIKMESIFNNFLVLADNTYILMYGYKLRWSSRLTIHCELDSCDMEYIWLWYCSAILCNINAAIS